MFAAIDSTTDTAVSAPEASPTAATTDAPERYRCLFCDDPVVLDPRPDAGHSRFQHRDGVDCHGHGNMSLTHRLGQEVLAAELFNLVPATTAPEIAIESSVGTATEYVFPDVCVRAPVKVAAEVVYRGSTLDLQRRLRILFERGYAVCLVAVTTGSLSAAKIERELQPVGEVTVGTFDPDSLRIRFGSLLRPETIDLSTDQWGIVGSRIR